MPLTSSLACGPPSGRARIVDDQLRDPHQRLPERCVTGRTYDAFEHWPEATVVARFISEEEAANAYKPPVFA
jgi:hypothetical protein